LSSSCAAVSYDSVIHRRGAPWDSEGLWMASSEARARLFNFVCIEPFHRLWTKHGLTEDDLIRLENEILASPRKGMRSAGPAASGSCG